jgi:hypothetical protein
MMENKVKSDPLVQPSSTRSIVVSLALLIAGALVLFLWRTPLVWWLSPVFLIR